MSVPPGKLKTFTYSLFTLLILTTTPVAAEEFKPHFNELQPHMENFTPHVTAESHIMHSDTSRWIDIEAIGITNGIHSYNATVKIRNPDYAVIKKVRYPDWVANRRTIEVNSSTVTIHANDTFGSIDPGTDDPIRLARLRVKSLKPGRTRIDTEVHTYIADQEGHLNLPGIEARLFITLPKECFKKPTSTPTPTPTPTATPTTTTPKPQQKTPTPEPRKTHHEIRTLKLLAALFAIWLTTIYLTSKMEP